MATKTKRPGKWSSQNKRNKITVRITFDDDSVYLFGTSHRTWWSQLKEFIHWEKPGSRIKYMDVSKEPWIWFGGLKWAVPEALQNELDKEGKERKAEAFQFEPASDWEWDRFQGDEFA